MRTFIYALKDKSNSIRYIGKTVNPEKRHGEHIRDLRRDDYRTRWIRKCIREGYEPQMDIIEIVEGDGDEAEMYWIRFMRNAMGYVLVNGTDGGEGMAGRIVSEETRNKIRIANTGKSPSEETRRKISRSLTGLKHSVETRQKVSAALKRRGGKPHTAESKRKISLAKTGAPGPMKGRRHTEQTKQKIRDAKRNPPPISEETRMKLSEATKRYWRCKQENECKFLRQRVA